MKTWNASVTLGESETDNEPTNVNQTSNARAIVAAKTPNDGKGMIIDILKWTLSDGGEGKINGFSCAEADH